MVLLNCFTLDNAHPLAASDLYLPLTIPVPCKLKKEKYLNAGLRDVRQGSMSMAKNSISCTLAAPCHLKGPFQGAATPLPWGRAQGRSRFLPLHPCGTGPAAGARPRGPSSSSAPLGLPEGTLSLFPPWPNHGAVPPRAMLAGMVLSKYCVALRHWGKEEREKPNKGAIKVNCFYCWFNSVL